MAPVRHEWKHMKMCTLLCFILHSYAQLTFCIVLLYSFDLVVPKQQPSTLLNAPSFSGALTTFSCPLLTGGVMQPNAT